MRIPLALAAACTFFAPVAAQAFADAATGFAISPPAPFLATPSARKNFDVGADIASATGQPAQAGSSSSLCSAGFKAAPQNASLDQAAINAFAGKPEYRDMVKGYMGLAFKIESIRTVSIGGVRGVEVIAIPKQGPDAQNVRAYTTIHESPKGRVTLTCATTRKDWAKALGSFRAIRNSITIPK